MARKSAKMGAGFWDWFKSKAPSNSTPPPMHVDLYQVLGVPPNASQEAIKRAFRDQAMKFHPDRNPDDPRAEQMYTQISAAYAILGDEAQRAAYDRNRSASAPPRPTGGGTMVPRSGQPGEELISPPESSRKLSRSLEPKSMIERMFGVAKEEAPQGSLFDILSPGQPSAPPARIPVPGTPFSAFNPSAGRVPMMPSIDGPDDAELWQIVQHWPLDPIWDLVRGERRIPEFQRAGAIAVDALAGAGEAPAEWDLAEIFGIPARQVDDFVKTKGRESFYVNVLYPIFDKVTAIMDKLKPPDVPGKFFLDWDPNGRVIELIYAENVGRRP